MIYTEPRDVIFLGSPVWRAFNMSFRIEYFEWVTWLGLHRAAKLPSPHSWSKFFERYPEAGRRMTRFMRKTVRDNGSPK
jgi:hypothetical protein